MISARWCGSSARAATSPGSCRASSASPDRPSRRRWSSGPSPPCPHRGRPVFSIRRTAHRKARRPGRGVPRTLSVDEDPACTALGPRPAPVLAHRRAAPEALAGSAPLPCDNCQYRAAGRGRGRERRRLEGAALELRHGYTHTQAMPHVHAHRPLTKHVLVCGNVDCAERGSVPLIGDPAPPVQAPAASGTSA